MGERSCKRSTAAAVICALILALIFTLAFASNAAPATKAAANVARPRGLENLGFVVIEAPANGSPSEKAEPTTVELMMVGDILMHDELVFSGAQDDGSFDYGFLYDHITDYIDAADIRMLNQETVMGEPERGYYYHRGAAGPIMNSPTALADTEVAYGFNVILKAHNHAYDLWYSGLAHELDYWKSAHPEIPVLGVDNPYAEPGDDSQDYVDNVYVREVNGMRIAFLNYTSETNENPDWETQSNFVSYLSEEKIARDVEQARELGAEMIVACPHWGLEYTTVPSEEERYYARVFCELGVDVILGCHPHILQPLELLESSDGHKTVCFYSLGNFVAAGGMKTDSLIGGIARVTLTRDELGHCSVSTASIVPTVICYTFGPNMSAWPLTEWTLDLAYQSYRSDCTPSHVYDFCAELYGDMFDPEACVVTLDMGGEARTV